MKKTSKKITLRPKKLLTKTQIKIAKEVDLRVAEHVRKITAQVKDNLKLFVTLNEKIKSYLEHNMSIVICPGGGGKTKVRIIGNDEPAKLSALKERTDDTFQMAILRMTGITDETFAEDLMKDMIEIDLPNVTENQKMVRDMYNGKLPTDPQKIRQLESYIRNPDEDESAVLPESKENQENRDKISSLSPSLSYVSKLS